jgi:hypothetical protein
VKILPLLRQRARKARPEPASDTQTLGGEWRPRPESNWDTRICSPLRNHSATRPIGAVAAITGCDRIAILNTAFSEKKFTYIAFVRQKYAQGDATQCPPGRGSPPAFLAKMQSSEKNFAFFDCIAGAGLSIRRASFPDSSAVEHSTVNRMVVGSNPTRGATLSKRARNHLRARFRFRSRRLFSQTYQRVGGILSRHPMCLRIRFSCALAGMADLLSQPSGPSETRSHTATITRTATGQPATVCHGVHGMAEAAKAPSSSRRARRYATAETTPPSPA